MFTPAHLLVCTLAVFADRDRSAELPELLRRIEPLPERQSGEVRVVHPGDPPDDPPSEYVYQYALDGKHFFWQTTVVWRGEAELNQSMVWGGNERYSFELARHNGRWVLSRIVPVRWRVPSDSRLRPHGGKDYLADSVFSRGYTVESTDRPLSGLLTGGDTALGVTATRVGPQVYRVTGRRREPSADGLQEFDASVRVAANGRYAYIAGGKTVWVSQSADRSETEWTHTTREGDDRPDLTRREWVSRRAGPGGERVTRGHSTYTSRPVTDDDRRRMYLQHYGLNEPDVDSWPEPAEIDFQAGVPRPHRGWWALLAVPAAYLLILGRILWRAFTRPLKAAP